MYMRTSTPAIYMLILRAHEVVPGKEVRADLNWWPSLTMQTSGGMLVYK